MDAKKACNLHQLASACKEVMYYINREITEKHRVEI